MLRHDQQNCSVEPSLILPNYEQINGSCLSHQVLGWFIHMAIDGWSNQRPISLISFSPPMRRMVPAKPCYYQYFTLHYFNCKWHIFLLPTRMFSAHDLWYLDSNNSGYLGRVYFFPLQIHLTNIELGSTGPRNNFCRPWALYLYGPFPPQKNIKNYILRLRWYKDRYNPS